MSSALTKTAGRGRAYAWAWLLIIMTLLSVGCTTSVTQTGPGVPPAPMPGALAPGDVVRISFIGAPDMNQTQKIRADGRISLPTIGEVQATGKTPGTLQRQLTDRYRSSLKNPEVVVAVEASGISVYVSGAVIRPGRVALGREMTALEAIMEAGGFAPGLGDPSKVVLIRTGNGRHSTRVLDLSPALRGIPTGVVYLQANDVIYVHERFF